MTEETVPPCPLQKERRASSARFTGRRYIVYPIRRWQRPASPRHFSSAEAKAIDLLEGLYPRTPGPFGGDGFLHDGSPNAQRADDLLCAVLHPLQSRQVKLAGFTPYPDQEWMEQQAAQHDDGGVGKPERRPLPAA